MGLEKKHLVSGLILMLFSIALVPLVANYGLQSNTCQDMAQGEKIQANTYEDHDNIIIWR